MPGSLASRSIFRRACACDHRRPDAPRRSRCLPARGFRRPRNAARSLWCRGARDSRTLRDRRRRSGRSAPQSRRRDVDRAWSFSRPRGWSGRDIRARRYSIHHRLQRQLDRLHGFLAALDAGSDLHDPKFDLALTVGRGFRGHLELDVELGELECQRGVVLGMGHAGLELGAQALQKLREPDRATVTCTHDVPLSIHPACRHLEPSWTILDSMAEANCTFKEKLSETGLATLQRQGPNATRKIFVALRSA